MLVAGERRRLAVQEIVRGMRMHDGKAGLEQRGLDELAEPGALPLDSAIRMPTAANSPVEMSTSGTPIRIGPLAGEPVAAIMPVMAWMMAS